MWSVTRRHPLLLSLVCLSFACGNDKQATTQGSEEKEEVDYAKLFGVGDAQQEAREASKQMKSFEERIAAKKEAEREAEWTQLLVVPAGAPSEIKEACDAMTAAYESFMDSRVSGVAGERWNATKEADIKNLREKCVSDNDPRVAACEANVFQQASMYITEDDLTSVITRCEETVGQAAAAG